MAYNFKRLSNVDVVDSMKEGLNVLVEDQGKVVKLAANKMIPEDVALKSDIPADIALKSDIPSDDHINELINNALGAIENGTY